MHRFDAAHARHLGGVRYAPGPARLNGGTARGLCGFDKDRLQRRGPPGTGNGWRQRRHLRQHRRLGFIQPLCGRGKARWRLKLQDKLREGCWIAQVAFRPRMLVAASMVLFVARHTTFAADCGRVAVRLEAVGVIWQPQSEQKERADFVA
jgi:hypothetical protein